MSEEMKKAFEKSQAKRKKAKEEKENRLNNGFGSYTSSKKCSPIKESQRAFRFLGLPPNVRSNSTDAKRILFSRMVKDNGKGYVEIVWKQTPEGGFDKDWLLYELVTDIMSFDWVDYTEEEKKADPNKGKGYYKYHNELVPVFRRLYENKAKDELYR